MMKMFEIDDGATHWIVADTEAEAFGLYAENLIMSGSDWPDEKPAIGVRDPEKEFNYRVDGEKERIKLKTRVWCEILTKPQYLACSEF